MNKVNQGPEKSQLTKSGILYILRLHVQLVLMAAAFFVSAGSLSIGRSWIYFGVVSISYMLSTLIFLRFSPELLNERAKDRDNTKSWDKVLLGLYLITAFYGINIVAGLDVGRFNRSYIPQWALIPGAALYIGASMFGTWAMVVNKHFEATVRIQKDRGHKVIKEGPYKIVRHPGYLSILLAILAVPLMTGSAYAFICSGAVIIIMIIRTFLEDKMLQQELEGYLDYTKEVKYRLIPFIW